MKGAAPTMQDVADAAGVSRAAVCYALRNDPRLPAVTRKRIQREARRLGYRPNPLVSVLMANLAVIKRKPFPVTLAFISAYPYDDNFRRHAYLRAFFSGASVRAAAGGFRMEAFSIREPQMSLRRIFDILWARAVPGLLLAPTPLPANAAVLPWENFACACSGTSVGAPGLHTVTNDQFRSLKSALGKLQGLGYRRIGLVIDRASDDNLDNVWTASFAAFQAKLPLAQRIPVLVGTEDARPLLGAWFKREVVEAPSVSQGEDSRSLLGAWFKRHRPDVVVSSYGRSIFARLKALGVKVPADTGFFDIDLPPGNRSVSGLNQRQDLIGAAAVDLVIEQLRHNERGIPAHPKRVLLMSEWAPGRTIRQAPRIS